MTTASPPTDANDARFSALLGEHAGIVRKVATTYCRNAEDRADLAQQIVAQLWQSWPRYEATRPFPTWMYRVALNVAISHVRDVYRIRKHFVPMEPAHEEVADTEVDHATNQLLASLRLVIDRMDGMNRALLLLYLDDRSHREIAEILGLSESNVGTKFARLKRGLQAELS